MCYYFLLTSCLLCYYVLLVLAELLFLTKLVFAALLFLTKLVFTRATKKGATKKVATAQGFFLGGHPVQRLIDVRKRGVGQQYLVLWGDGTKSWAPARDIEKEPELLRAFEDGL
jgi:hypothetical protein